MRKEEIVEFATGLKRTYHTSDPYELAKIFGIRVEENIPCMKWFKAQAVKFKGYAPYIVINRDYDERSRRIMCAHELGHIFLHDDTLNNFANVGGKINMEAEYEANLFVLALFEDQENLNMNMADIPSYLVHSIIEKSVERK
ncbi:ImmA/IrrE family metallo-endopeptidase [Butyrivibrio sp. VCD2006]|uniref:ImmA/IrrE family metallo-endopeptidase n=1 Tax=Butyrivibrio sp. VCD2006 TaxID=1280664 RepID=UPI0004038FB3|nr:ImmA/IrrE family metallo-endopeptidase [Butyrivibrio sp. VCD2006]